MAYVFNYTAEVAAQAAVDAAKTAFQATVQSSTVTAQSALMIGTDPKLVENQHLARVAAAKATLDTATTAAKGG